MQLGVYNRGTQTMQNLGSGAILAGGRVLTCAHNVMDPFSEQMLVAENCVVLVAAFTATDEPARWAYVAEVLTPLAVLREKHEEQLLDLALLQITSAVTCDPPQCPGKDAVMVRPQPTFEVVTETDATSFDDVPCLRCDPADALHADGLAPKVTIIGYPALSGELIYASERDVVSLSGGFLQTQAFVDTGSSGGPVINANGDIVAVVSKGGGLPFVLQGGEVVELAKTRRVTFLRDDHAPPPPPPPAAAVASGDDADGSAGGCTLTLHALLQPHGLQEHAAVLEENGFALASAGELTSDDLKEMGIAKLKERKDMLKAFQAYAASCAD